MRNHFIIPYAGNKRQEVEFLHDYLVDKLDCIDTIIEPFCGSSAMSVSLSIKYPKRFKYKLNDLDDKLIELYHIMNDKDKLKLFTIECNEKIKLLVNKEGYNSVINDGTFTGWFISKKIYAIRAGLYKLNYKPKIYDFENTPIVKFLRTEDVVFTCVDGIDIIKENKDNTNCLLLIDPPYILSDNYQYTNKSMNIYEYCLNTGIGNMKSMVVLVLEENWIIKMIFKEFIRRIYTKTYEAKHRKTNHIIISNNV